MVLRQSDSSGSHVRRIWNGNIVRKASEVFGDRLGAVGEREITDGSPSFWPESLGK